MDRRSLLIGAGAAALTGGAVALAGHPATAREASSLPFSAELDALVERARRRLGGVAGLSVAVCSSDGRYTRGFGVTDVTTGERAGADTAFYIASSTKPLTALALSSMAARGEIDLDATLASFAPDAPFPARVRASEVTFRHLLSHTSGLGCDPISFRLALSGQHDPDLLWRLLSTSRPNDDAPLGTFSYINSGYNIATILTDRQFGRPWQDMLDREVFGPAGMAHATARMSRAHSAGWSVAKPHIALPEGVTKLYLEKTDRTMQSAGGVIMSANDAVRWLDLMINAGAIEGRQAIPDHAVLVTRKRIAALTDEFAGYKPDAYGLGWYHVPYRGELMLQHLGGFSGSRSHVSYIPARRVGVAAFANESGAASHLANAVANYVYDRAAGRRDAVSSFNAKVEELIGRRDRYFESVRAERAARAGQAWTLTRPFGAYAGSYENRDYGRIEVIAEGNGLNLALGVLHAAAAPSAQPDTISVELLPYSAEVVAFEGDPPSALQYDGQNYRRV